MSVQHHQWSRQRQSIVREVRALAKCNNCAPVSAHRRRNCHGDNIDVMETLERQFPASTITERQRFLKARGNNVVAAAEKLGEYMAWRDANSLDLGHGQPIPTGGPDDDAKDWEYASAKALRWQHKQLEQNAAIDPAVRKKLKKWNSRRKSQHPIRELAQMIFVYRDDNNGQSGNEASGNESNATGGSVISPANRGSSDDGGQFDPDQEQPSLLSMNKPALAASSRPSSSSSSTTTTNTASPTAATPSSPPCWAKARDGTILLHVIPALIQKKGVLAETYAMAIALYLDRKFSRDSLELATVFLDVRPGMGWPNPPAIQMLSFIRATSRILHAYYPERLASCILYPLPRAAMWIWDAVKPFLDNEIVTRVSLVQGSDARSALPPNDELEAHAQRKWLEQMEIMRLLQFR